MDPSDNNLMKSSGLWLKNPNNLLKFFHDHLSLDERILNHDSKKLALCNSFRYHLFNPEKILLKLACTPKTIPMYVIE